MRGIQYAAAFQFDHWRLWDTGSPAFAGDDSHRRSFAFSPRVSREFCWRLLALENKEGAGNAGCTLHPRSHAQCAQKVRARAYRAAEAIRHSLRNGFTAYSALSPVNGLCCHRRRRDLTHQLDTSVAASGPHVFAVRFSAVRYRHLRVHRSPPHVRDDHDTPLFSGRDGDRYALFRPSGKAKYFLFWGLT
jgi:hypothetical protein